MSKTLYESNNFNIIWELKVHEILWWTDIESTYSYDLDLILNILINWKIKLVPIKIRLYLDESNRLLPKWRNEWNQICSLLYWLWYEIRDEVYDNNTLLENFISSFIKWREWKKIIL